MMMSPESPESGSRVASASNGTITVLLVDDQRIIGEVVRRMFLDQPDITFHYCADGTQAVARVQEIKPDVILQDLVLPEIDGVELVRQYRAQESSRTTPVIVLSAAEDAATRTRAAEAGANEFMVKPPPKAALIERIRALLGPT